jgi:hypothetical protein
VRTIAESIAMTLELLREARPADAEALLGALIADNPARMVQDYENDLQAVIDRFLPKRKKRLLALLECRLDLVRSASTGTDTRRATRGGTVDEPALGRFSLSLGERYGNLSANHIFQWGTHYRDQIREIADYAAHLSNTHELEALDRVILDQTHLHAAEIFGKGHEYAKQVDEVSAMTKSVSGLKRFLDLPLELYTDRLSTTNRTHDMLVLRHVCSSLLAGILQGYSSVVFDGETGWDVLARERRVWAHSLVFLTARDLDMTVRPDSDDRVWTGFRENLGLLAKALDLLSPGRLHSQVPIFIPVFGQFHPESSRVEVGVALFDRGADRGRSMDMRIYVREDPLSESELDNASYNGVDLVIGRVPAALPASLDQFMCDSVLDISVLEGDTALADLEKRLGTFFAPSGTHGMRIALTSNVAKKFPLNNPFKTAYYLVQRPSVRQLMTSIESRNGIHLWCSPRRSGKTTACFNMGSGVGKSGTVLQTCIATGQFPGDRVFIEEVERAIDGRKRLPSDFLVSVLARCPGSETGPARTVFLLDEYESLFHQLKIAAAKDGGDLRYKVVQPLLEQMVGFSESNLLVLVGQSPDAHFILMDQNQLSAYVVSDNFPLFAHQSRSQSSEFTDLVGKIMSTNYLFPPEFTDAIYWETGGHPFLTVKLLVSLFEHMIANRRPANDTQITEEHYLSFAEEHLKDESLRESGEYDFFKHAIAHALGDGGRHQAPWLHAVYRVMKAISLRHLRSGGCRKEEYLQIWEELRLSEDLGLDPIAFLTSATKANFFESDGLYVRPRIPLLARIARITTPEVL